MLGLAEGYVKLYHSTGHHKFNNHHGFSEFTSQFPLGLRSWWALPSSCRANNWQIYYYSSEAIYCIDLLMLFILNKWNFALFVQYICYRLDLQWSLKSHKLKVIFSLAVLERGVRLFRRLGQSSRECPRAGQQYAGHSGECAPTGQWYAGHCFPPPQPWGAQASSITCVSCYIQCHQRTKQPWTEISKTVSQNKLFLFGSYHLSPSLHNTRTNTSPPFPLLT